MRRGTPRRSIASIARGSAASLDVVENAMTAGSFTALMNLRIGHLEDAARPAGARARIERRQREVERADQPGQVVEHAEAAVADRVGDRRADADRRVVHDDVRELEHRLGERLAPARPSAGPSRRPSPSAIAKMMLKTTICSTSPSAIASMTDVGNDVEQDLIPRLRACAVIVGRRPHRQVHADAGLREVDREQADQQRERRDDLEVDHRAQPHAADDLEVARAGDAGDQRREDQRRDDHLDQAQEELAERPEVERPGRVVRLDQGTGDDAECQADEDLLGQREAAA